MVNDNNTPKAQTQTEVSEIKLSKIYQFFCWCSGARIYLLKKCPTEFNKFFGIGAVVLFTGILAFISGSYAFYTIFQTHYLSVVFGLFWGVLIFFLDWYIVASIRKEGSFRKEFGTVFPRLILSVFLAVVITKPLELRIFQNEINQEIVNLKADKSINTKNKIFLEFDEIALLENEIKTLTQEIEPYEKRRYELYNEIIAEAEGRSVTNKSGKGPVYKEKKNEFDKADATLTEIRTRNNQLIDQKLNQINQLKANRNKVLTENSHTISAYDGLLARLQALSSLTQQNKFINIANWFIILLFIVIESSPILVKLMAKKGPYDYLMELEEFKTSSSYYYERNSIKNKISSQLNTMREAKQSEEKVQQEVINDYAHTIKEAVNRINKTQIERWENETLKEVNQSNKIIDILNRIQFPGINNHDSEKNKPA